MHKSTSNACCVQPCAVALTAADCRANCCCLMWRQEEHAACSAAFAFTRLSQKERCMRRHTACSTLRPLQCWVLQQKRCVSQLTACSTECLATRTVQCTMLGATTGALHASAHCMLNSVSNAICLKQCAHVLLCAPAGAVGGVAEGHHALLHGGGRHARAPGPLLPRAIWTEHRQGLVRPFDFDCSCCLLVEIQRV
eukprot:scaffold257006_cov26-Tisochrysis_lutea.AAC.1